MIDGQITTGIGFYCESLMDQERYIGNDPVGHACWRHAEVEMPDGRLLCNDCVKMLATEPQRITFPPGPYGREYQKAAFEKAWKQFKAPA